MRLIAPSEEMIARNWFGEHISDLAVAGMWRTLLQIWFSDAHDYQVRLVAPKSRI